MLININKFKIIIETEFYKRNYFSRQQRAYIVIDPHTNFVSYRIVLTELASEKNRVI